MIRKGYGMQKSATQQFQSARKEAHATYMRPLSIVRLDIDPQSEYWDVLKIKGPRKQTISGWLGQVTAFYDNIGRVQDILDKHGITAAEVAQAQAMIEAIDAFSRDLAETVVYASFSPSGNNLKGVSS